MSVNTKSKARRALRHWRKGLVALGAAIVAPSPILFALYLGFWIGRYTVGLKITRTRKETQ